MSDETSSSNSVVVTLEEENPSFLNGGVDLKKLQKDLARHSKAAIEVLVAELQHKTSAEIRIRAATKLLEFQVQVAKEINADQVQRMIAEIKLNRNPQNKLIPVKDSEDGEEKNKPIVDFSNIREVE
jgi:hypothetical protein